MLRMFSDIIKGGPGSGNFGHAGVKGKRGGSSPGGGKHRVGTKSRSQHVDQQQVINAPGATYSDKMSNFIANDLGVSRQEADSYQEAIRGFAGSEYREIRSASVGQDANEDIKRKAQNMDKFINKSPKFEGEVHRGVIVSPEEANALKAGATINMKGMSSWSSDQGIAESFASGAGNNNQAVIFHVNNKSGASIAHLAAMPYQKEVVAPSTAKYGIQQTQNKGSTLHVYLTEN
jgi:hypothetical protein